MKAIRVHTAGGPEVMRIEDVADPHPGPAQVLVRIAAAGVNPVDTYIRSGAQNYRAELPYTPGIDGAGVVQAAGEQVERVRPGDRVYVAGSVSGTYAEMALCEETQVHPIPPSVSFSEGAAIDIPYATAFRALFQRGRALPGETVLIHGATGGVGTAAVQMAVSAGLTVVGTGGTEAGRSLVRDLGAVFVIDHNSPGYLDEIGDLSGGRGVEIILEMLANVNLDNDLSILAPRGRVVIIGNRGRIEIDPRKTMAGNLDIRGCGVASREELKVAHAAIGAGLRSGTIKPIVREELPLEKAPQAHELVMSPGAYGNIVLVT